MRRIRRRDETESHYSPSALFDLQEQVQIAQHQWRALQYEDRESQVITDLQHMPGNLEFSLSGLVIAGKDQVRWDFSQFPAQQLRRVFLDLNDIRKITWIIVRTVFSLAAVAESAAM